MKLTSEDAFLELIDSHFPRENQFLKMGRGDDCAVLKAEGELCISSDLFVEDVHFRRSYFGPGDIGYKALAVNISDICGMGARPRGFNMDLMIPEGLDPGYWDAFFRDMAALARQNELALAGGDLSRSDKLGVNITIWGSAGPGRVFIPRQKNKPGDILFTCGELGLARVGLLALEEQGLNAAKSQYPQAVMAHLRPKPKAMVGTLLSAAGATSLMDVSDGLARDLPRLLAPGNGAAITIGEDMIHAEVRAFAQAKGARPEELVFLGGEDYALLGSADQETFASKISSIPGIRQIGLVTEKGITVNGKECEPAGFDHFA
ncbi:thiamine-phosphate kinase [Salidesulfovibrio onnuriiensis]|uniref:thiamine-phosphate kinase n=1 Tax=Salidesulfovibrio onnuriiensis TaxID=2583823 RepID=UPI0011CC7A79|nr:thiamine-phosphate kinase [Salidesulfovibrio onnuriiensis]